MTIVVHLLHVPSVKTLCVKIAPLPNIVGGKPYRCRGTIGTLGSLRKEKNLV